MRVLHMFTNPHLTNGATIFEYRISEFLKDENIFFDYLVTEEATEEEIQRYRKVDSHLYKLPIDNTHGLLIRELKINFQYYKFFKNHDYKIVYADTENALRSIHLLMARLAGVPVRVVHSHNTGLQTESKMSRRISRWLRGFFLFSATDYFACSDLAAEWLFPKQIYKRKKYSVLKNGVNLDMFRFDPGIRVKMRMEAGIDMGLVVGNVGRFMPQKNHRFLIDIFYELLKRKKDAVLLLIGDGPLRRDIEKYVEKKGLSDKVLFVGNVENVSQYLQMMDIFVMPSLFEGLPITGIEAQASGLPCLFSDTITKELAITPLVEYCSIQENAAIWAEHIVKFYENVDRKDVSNDIIDAGYSINSTVNWLNRFYRMATDK